MPFPASAFDTGGRYRIRIRPVCDRLKLQNANIGKIFNIPTIRNPFFHSAAPDTLCRKSGIGDNGPAKASEVMCETTMRLAIAASESQTVRCGYGYVAGRA